jgi:transposase
LPVAVHFFTEQTYSGENEPLKEAVLAFKPQKQEMISVFDRGITSRKTYDEFIEEKIPFITRLSLTSKRRAVSDNQITTTIQTSTLEIHSERSIYLFKTRGVQSKYPVRCIEALRKDTGEPLIFITNIKAEDLNAEEITMLYKQRWDIEVFFKFIKQELNFSHLVNRSENGIKVMLYCTLIAAILLIAYKELNGLKGYKIMKQKFVHDLEKTLMKDFILLCGGDPQWVDKLLKISPG